jgi:hypothetical protein
LAVQKQLQSYIVKAITKKQRRLCWRVNND